MASGLLSFWVFEGFGFTGAPGLGPSSGSSQHLHCGAAWCSVWSRPTKHTPQAGAGLELLVWKQHKMLGVLAGQVLRAAGHGGRGWRES